jgi:hypothetical protein
VSEITIELSDRVEAFAELVVARFGMTREQAVKEMLEQYVEGAKAPGTGADEEQFRAALEQTLTKNAELYRRLAQH